MRPAVRVLWLTVLGVGLLVVGLVVALAIASVGDPGRDSLTMTGTRSWTTVGPHLSLLSLLVLALSAIAVRRGHSRGAMVVAVVAAVAVVMSVAITGRIVLAADAAGGSVNPLAGLALGSMTAPLPDSREMYTTVDGRPQELVIYQPTPATTFRAPVLMYIHGGGWTGGTAGDTAHDLRWFADRGWLVISVDYPLATAAYATWDKAPASVACALVWTAGNAARLGGDAERLVVAGDSAGGNLAVNLAYSAATGEARSSCGGQVPTPQALVVQYPVVDPQDAYDHGAGPPGSAADPLVFTQQYIGGTPQQFPDRMKAISSATYLSDKAPQTLIIEPDNDGLIPTAGVMDFVAQARAAGVDLTLVGIPFANHGYDSVAADSIGNQARLSITLRYLEDRGL